MMSTGCQISPYSALVIVNTGLPWPHTAELLQFNTFILINIENISNGWPCKLKGAMFNISLSIMIQFIDRC